MESSQDDGRRRSPENKRRVRQSIGEHGRSKSDEAAVEAQRTPVVQQGDGPPTYESHEYDEVFTEEDARNAAAAAAAQDRTGTLRPPLQQHRASLVDVTDESLAGPARKVREDSYEPPLLPPGPLSLTMDETLIYPTHPPSTALYHIPRTLTFSGNEVYLERSVPGKTSVKTGKTAKAKDKQLYEMRRIPWTSEIELRPKRAATYGPRPGAVAEMKQKRALFGNVWEVRFDGALALRFSGGKWKDGGGQLVAAEEKDSWPPVMVISEGVPEDLRDFVVAGWCTRVWQQGMDNSLVQTLTRGQGTDTLPRHGKRGDSLGSCADTVRSCPGFIDRDFPAGRTFTQRLAGA